MLNIHSIKFKIGALCGTMMIIGVIVRHFIALPLAQEHLRQMVASQHLSIATYVARDIDQSITARLSLIGRLAADFPLTLADDRVRLDAWLKDRQRLNPMFGLGLLAIRSDGKGLIGEYPTVAGREQLDFANSEWFVEAARSEKPVISRPFRGRVSGEPVTLFAAPVRDASGKLVAVVAGVALLNAPDFLDRLQATQLGQTGGFLLISPADRLFVASTKADMVLKPTPPEGVNLLHDRAMAGFRGTGITINAFGVEELAAMVTVPSTGWFVVARTPTAEAFRPIETLRAFVVGSTGLMLFFLFGGLLVPLAVILRPLIHTARAIRDMADGKRELAPLPVVRNDEVGNVVSGFNYLVSKLHAEEQARRTSEARLEYLAHHDSLTGLYNRAMLKASLEQAVARADRNGNQLAMLFCDLDDFKAINDLYGHETGDAVLCEVARRLAAGRRHSDTVARLGGDEFVILLADLADARAAAMTVAEDCLVAMAEPFEKDGRKLVLSMSIGISVHDGTAVTPSYLMSKADLAMYRAKHSGKGGYFLFEESGPAQATDGISHST